MSINWMRHFELLLTDDRGGGISLSEFKVVFNIEKMPVTVINGSVGNFRVYNLSPNTQNRIMGKEFSRIQVIAGYDGIASDVPAREVGKVKNITAAQVGQYDGQNFGEIFNGDIRFTITGKDNGIDSWILLQCVDSHNGDINAGMNMTVAKGWTFQDLFDMGMQSFAPYGISAGSTPDMPVTAFPRGRVIYKSTREVMSDIAGQCDANWWYEGNQVHIVPEDKYVQEAIVLNSSSGLIGMPQQTMGAGVNVRCLINPNIRMGGLIQIDQASVYRAALSNEEIAKTPGRISEATSNGNLVVNGTISQPASVNLDGQYIVGSIDYTGDTRGQAWYMDMICLAKGSADLMSPSTVAKVGLE